MATIPFLLHMGEIEMPIPTPPDHHSTWWMWPWSPLSPSHKGEHGVVHLLILLNCDTVRGKMAMVTPSHPH